MCPESIVKILICLFFAVTFLQSGIDKVINKDGNLGWFKSVFEKTILGKIITPLFYWITIQEIAVGIIMLIAAFVCGFGFCTNCFASEWGYVLCLAVLIQLFIGQRLAKDYVGATGIIPYIILALAGYLFLGNCCGGGEEMNCSSEEMKECKMIESIPPGKDSIMIVKKIKIKEDN